MGVYLQKKKTPLAIEVYAFYYYGPKFFFVLCRLDDCLIALKFSKNAPISKLVFVFELQFFVTELRFTRVHV